MCCLFVGVCWLLLCDVCWLALLLFGVVCWFFVRCGLFMLSLVCCHISVASLVGCFVSCLLFVVLLCRSCCSVAIVFLLCAYLASCVSCGAWLVVDVLPCAVTWCVWWSVACWSVCRACLLLVVGC